MEQEEGLAYISRSLILSAACTRSTSSAIPVRRRILELLADGEQASGAVTETIRAEFGISQPAVSQHLRVLREAGFATVRPDGTRRLYAVNHEPLQDVDAWLERFRAFWTQHLDALDTELARGKRTKGAVNDRRQPPHQHGLESSRDADAGGRRGPRRHALARLRHDAGRPVGRVHEPGADPRWFLPISGDLRPGGRFAFEGNASGTISRCEPPRRIDATWEAGGQTSWVELRLRRSRAAARVSRSSTSRTSPTTCGPSSARAPSGSAGTAPCSGLTLYLDGGERPESIEAWSASDEGRAFYSQASERWVQASVDAGTPSGEAQAAGERVTGFYTGA